MFPFFCLLFQFEVIWCRKSPRQQSLLSKKKQTNPLWWSRVSLHGVETTTPNRKVSHRFLLPNAWLIQFRSKGLTLRDELHKCHLSDSKIWLVTLVLLLVPLSRAWIMQFQKWTLSDVTRGYWKGSQVSGPDLLTATLCLFLFCSNKISTKLKLNLFAGSCKHGAKCALFWKLLFWFFANIFFLKMLAWLHVTVVWH